MSLYKGLAVRVISHEGGGIICLPADGRTLAGDYFSAQIAGATISVTAPAREVAAVIVDAPLPAPMRVLVPAHRLATAGLLPPRLRDEYGLRWSALHELALPLAARSLRLATTPAIDDGNTTSWDSFTGAPVS